MLAYESYEMFVNSLIAFLLAARSLIRFYSLLCCALRACAGLECGHICIVHLKLEEQLMRFELETWGAVTALAFRTGSPPTLTTHDFFYQLQRARVSKVLIKTYFVVVEFWSRLYACMYI